MDWIDRFKSLKSNPVGPDIANASWTSFTLSGTEIRFKCPLHEIASELQATSQTLDIYRDDLYEHPWNEADISMSASLRHSGWKLWSNSFKEEPIGDLSFSILLTKCHPNYRKIDSLFKPADIQNWILEYCDSGWGELNRELRGDDNDGMDILTYPRSAGDIQRTSINGQAWYSYSAQGIGGGKTIIWNFPISDSHALMFQFQPTPITRNYNEPENYLDDLAEKTVQEFMSHVHVKLSPDAQQRCDKVKSENQAS
ncbi:hypothetical protein BTA51_19190 [Hahella sp. CCB-MM4]|uniref:hypothetical protein n=1 Tax=Hahella sp. (strain CCB-MM4) TaxID=1926491 RepID=UPI000B9C50E1|nr:hypothetical protein [Hahella sp. CCB-MM4]OZG71847.1 hypothetical protein BTA51_19190 [Hahella sp. CCB-MM4]